MGAGNVAHRCEPAAKTLESLEILLDAAQVAARDLGEVGLALVQDAGDLLEREAELSQRHDSVEPGHIALGVEAVARLGALGGGEQADARRSGAGRGR